MTTGGRFASAAARRWVKAAEELAPEKSLARVNVNARNTIGATSLVATLMTAIGVSARLPGSYSASVIWVLAIGYMFVLLALPLAFVPLVIRRSDLNLDNLLEVEEWYRREFRLLDFAKLAGVFLACGVITIGAGVALSLVDRPGATSTLALDRAPATHGDVRIGVSVGVEGLKEGERINVVLTERGASGTRQILHAVRIPGRAGSISVTESITVTSRDAGCLLLTVSSARPNSSHTWTTSMECSRP